MKRLLFSTLFPILLPCLPMKAQLLALRTNALADAAMAPNLTLDIVTGSKTSVGMTVIGSVSVWGERWKTVSVLPEFRWWFAGTPLSRYYLGVESVAAKYDLRLNHQLYKGNAWGLGIIFGYDFYLCRRWSLDLGGGLLTMGYRQHRHYFNDIYDERQDYREHGFSLVPRLAVSVVYILK